MTGRTAYEFRYAAKDMWHRHRQPNHNVSVNDGAMTYYVEWDGYNKNDSIDLVDAAIGYAWAARYDFKDDPTPVTLIVTNLITKHAINYQIMPELDEEDV